jgi:sterol desaturase/sphingolipid hydroxylase (fatty acid hydroxylase superfamily)
VTCLEFVLAAVVAFSTMFVVDAAHFRYVAAVARRDRIRAARWSVLQGAASAVGFVLAVKVTVWLVLAELVGLWAGSRFALFRDPERED